VQNAEKQAATRESRDLARAIIRHLNQDRVFMSPGQENEIFSPVIDSLSPEIVHAGFKQMWSDHHMLVLLTGNIDLTDGSKRPEKVLIEAFEASRKAAVTSPVALGSPVFPYLLEPQDEGKIVDRRLISDLGVVQVDFENGVRLNLKQTDFKDNEIRADFRFGRGKSSLPPEKSGLADLSTDVINESGFGALTRDQLELALAGKSTDTVFVIGEDRFSLKGHTVTEEAPLLFQLAYNFFKDPGLREEAFALSMERFKQRYLELSSSVDGAMVLHGRRFFAGGDGRFGLPTFAQFRKLTLEDIQSWVWPLLENADIEVSVVGDFDVERVIDLAATYFGSLTKRGNPDLRLNPKSPVFPASLSLEHWVETKIPKGLVVVAWPTEDQWHIKRSRRLNMLAEVFSDRLRERIREKLGASYSPFAFNRPSRAYRGYGVFQTFVQTAPDEVDIIKDEILKIASELVRNGVTSEELKRALEPTITSIKDMLRTNGYWLNTVLSGSMRHPEQLDWYRSIAGDYAAITAGELSLLAGKYLINTNAAAIVILPQTGQGDSDSGPEKAPKAGPVD